jgi:hypothetical protein
LRDQMLRNPDSKILREGPEGGRSTSEGGSRERDTVTRNHRSCDVEPM